MGISSSLATAEECNKCSTPPITRILPKNCDPRSPSEGITRTPIEVACTPKNHGLKTQTVSSLTFHSPKRSKSDDVKHTSTPTFNNEPNNSNFNIEMETGDIVETDISADIDDQINDARLSDLKLNHQGVRNHSADDEIESVNEPAEKLEHIENKGDRLKKQLVYLETDIDGLEDNLNREFPIAHPRVRQLRKCQERIGSVSNDSNNMTTSLNLEDTLELDTLTAKIDSMSFIDVSFDDRSFLVSDNENESHIGGLTNDINEWLITIENERHSLIPFDIPIDTEEKLANVQKQCFTPDRIRTPKERTPLGCLIQNKVLEPVKETSNLKKKQWRGIEEERARRGLSLADENTPPMPPHLFEKVSSAPGKLMKSRRNIDWDHDNKTIFI